MKNKSIYRPSIETSTHNDVSSSQYSSTPKSQSFISQIVYPATLLECEESCYLVGWNTEQFECTIAGMLPISSIDADLYKSYSILNEAVRLAFENPNFSLSRQTGPYFAAPPSSSSSSSSSSLCKAPIILGVFQIPSSISMSQEYSVNERNGSLIFPIQDFQNNGIWITLTKEPRDLTASSPSKSFYSSFSTQVNQSKFKLKLQSIHSLGYRYDTSCYLIEYPPLPSHHLYHVITSSYYKEHFLFPTYFLTMSQTEILKSINIEYKDGEEDVLPIVSSTEKRRIDQQTISSKGKVGGSQTQKQATTPLSNPSRLENIRIILMQLNTSEDLLYWICFHLHEIKGKPLLLPSQDLSKNKVKSAVDYHQEQLKFIEKNEWFTSLCERGIRVLAVFIYAWYKLLVLLEIFLRAEIPFLRSILYFCNWKEIAPAQVTVRQNYQHNDKRSKMQKTKMNNQIPPIASTSDLKERKHSKRKTKDNAGDPVERREESKEKSSRRSMLSMFSSYFSLREWYFYSSERKEVRIMDTPYSLYRFSFFFYEIVQTIEQYYALLELFNELFPRTSSSTTQAREGSSADDSSSSSSTNTKKNQRSFFQRKYYYLQILHHLLFLIINASLGYFIAYLISQINNHHQNETLSFQIIANLYTLYHFLIIENLHWIQASPIGIKLNVLVVEKANYFMLRCIHYYIYDFLKIEYYPYCQLFLKFFFIYFPFSGITYQISLVLDMMMMITFPINILYFFVTYVTQLHSNLLFSLWLFFHGQKWNILRQRIDTYAYATTMTPTIPPSSSSSPSSSSAPSSNTAANLSPQSNTSSNSFAHTLSSSSSSEMYQSYYYSNQLLFGVLLFSIMFFLIPTVMIYYCFFLFIRVTITSFYFANWNIMIILKKFPWIYYCYYIFDYLFFTNRWSLIVDLPSTSTSASASSPLPSSASLLPATTNQRKTFPTEDRTVATHRQNKLKASAAPLVKQVANTTATTRGLKKETVPADQTSELSQPSEVSTDSEANDKKKDIPQRSLIEKKSLTLSHLNDPSGVDPGNYLPDYPSPSHSQSHSNHRIRNRKSLMMSLTEKYRKEAEEEEQQLLLSTAHVNADIANQSAAASSIGDDSPSEFNFGETKPRLNDKEVSDEVVGAFPSILPLLKESSSHEDDPFALNSNIYNDLQISLSELSDDITPRERGHAQSDQWEDSPLPAEGKDPQAKAHQTSLLLSNSSNSPIPNLSLGGQSIISMRLLPVRFTPIDLITATVELFFTSPFKMMNRPPTQYSFNILTTRQKILKFFETITRSRPLYLIYENNALRFTIFSPAESSLTSPKKVHDEALKEMELDTLIVRRDSIPELVRSLQSSQRDLSSSSTPRLSNQVGRSLPLDDYYRKKVLFFIFVIYSLYLIAFVWGITSLVSDQIVSLYKVSANALDSSSFEQIHTISNNNSSSVHTTRLL